MSRTAYPSETEQVVGAALALDELGADWLIYVTPDQLRAYAGQFQPYNRITPEKLTALADALQFHAIPDATYNIQLGHEGSHVVYVEVESFGEVKPDMISNVFEALSLAAQADEAHQVATQGLFQKARMRFWWD